MFPALERRTRQYETPRPPCNEPREVLDGLARVAAQLLVFPADANGGRAQGLLHTRTRIFLRRGYIRDAESIRDGDTYTSKSIKLSCSCSLRPSSMAANIRQLILDPERTSIGCTISDRINQLEFHESAIPRLGARVDPLPATLGRPKAQSWRGRASSSAGL